MPRSNATSSDRAHIGLMAVARESEWDCTDQETAVVDMLTDLRNARELDYPFQRLAGRAAGYRIAARAIREARTVPHAEARLAKARGRVTRRWHVTDDQKIAGALSALHHITDALETARSPWHVQAPSEPLPVWPEGAR